MANYSLILDAKFKPFSYAEMLAPVQAATTAHQALEEDYVSLATLAGQWEVKANSTRDPKAYRMYKKYADDLQARADQLLAEGLTMSSRKNMLDMKARYSKEIIPIEEAYKRREELAKEQKAAYLADPTKYFQRYAAQTSLDDFINNPEWNYGANYSGALLTKQVSEAAANLQRAMTSVSSMKSIGLPFQYQQRIQKGATPAEVLQAMLKDAQKGEPQAVTFLRNVRDQVMNASGIGKWADDKTFKELLSYANMGLYSGIGESAIKDYTDQFNMQNTLAALEAQRREAAQIRAERRAKAEAEDQQRVDRIKMTRPNLHRFYSKDEVAKQNEKVLSEIEKWKKEGFITSDGKFSQKGLEIVNSYFNEKRKIKTPKDAASGVGYSGYGTGTANNPSAGLAGHDFVNWASKHGLSSIKNSDGTYGTYYYEFNKYLQNTLSQAKSGKLVTGVANIDVVSIRPSQSQSQSLANLITAEGGNAKKVTGLNSDGFFEYRENKPSTFREEVKDNPITEVGMNPMSNEGYVKLANGLIYKIPHSVWGNSLYDPEKMTGDMITSNNILKQEAVFNSVRNKTRNMMGLPEASMSDRALGAVANMSEYLTTILDNNVGNELKGNASWVTEDLNSSYIFPNQ